MFSKELVEAVKFRTHNWKTVGSNPAAFTIFFLRILSYVCNREYKYTHVSGLHAYIKLQALHFLLRLYTFIKP